MPLPRDETPRSRVDVNSRVQLQDEGEVRVVVVASIALCRYTRGDDAGEAYAMVTLVESGWATATEVARAFGCARPTVYRARWRYERGGFGALVRAKSGPKGPFVLRDATARRLIVLKRKGIANTTIAQRLGVSEGGVRHALKRAGYRPAEASQAELPLTAEGTKPVMANDPAPVAVAVSAAPVATIAGSVETEVSPEALGEAKSAAAIGVSIDTDPSDRSGDRLMARMGLLDDAAPIFGTQANVAGAGALLAVPALVQSGVFEAARDVYGTLGAAFYGVRNVVMALLIMALLRVKRAEGLRETSPPHTWPGARSGPSA